MYYFSYNDYMDNMENGEINEIKKVEEKVEKYELINVEKQKCGSKYKIIEMLKDESNIKEFIHDFFNSFEMENIKYIDSLKGDSIISKIEDKEIFIVIKVIDEIDNNITYKMFESSIGIIKKWNDGEKINKRKPIVVPIVIYLGKEKWNMNFYNKSNKINYMHCEKNRINFSYNFINVNSLEISNLKKMSSNVVKEIIDIKIKFYK